jgi:tRNA(Ile)-lysidine synthase
MYGPVARTPEQSSFLRALAAGLDVPAGVRPGGGVLVAVSSGPDSVALLAGLAALAPSRNLRVTAGHVDHGLRGAEGGAEALLVERVAAAVGVPCVRRRLALRAGSGLEARARRARYRALAGLARDVGAEWIATAHTRDDQVETVLLRLLRGAGRRGLGAMRPVRGRLLRPLLWATRADVLRYLAERELPYAVDRTNADLRHARNRVRRLLVPFLESEFNPRLGPALAALADRLRDEDDLLEALAAARLPVLADEDGLRLPPDEPPALARRMIRAWVGRQGLGLHATHVERILDLARGRRRGTVAVPGPARVLVEGGRLVRRAGRGACPEPFALRVAPGGSVAHPAGRWRLELSARRPIAPDRALPAAPTAALFDADRLPPALDVRPPAPGDRVVVPGVGTRKLQDVLVDAKVGREARAAVPLLVAGDEILWVGGVLRGAGARVDAATTHVVEARLFVGGS